MMNTLPPELISLGMLLRDSVHLLEANNGFPRDTVFVTVATAPDKLRGTVGVASYQGRSSPFDTLLALVLAVKQMRSKSPEVFEEVCKFVDQAELGITASFRDDEIPGTEEPS